MVEVTEEISIDDLLGNVDRTAYYRYNGSLTTPSCNEAVVWTVFKDSIKVDRDLVCATYINLARNRRTSSVRPRKDDTEMQSYQISLFL